MIKKIFLLIGLLLLVTSVNGILNITVDEQTDNTLSWCWSVDYTITNLIIDGYSVPLFDNNSNRFDLTGLNPNEKHSIKIYSGIDNVSSVIQTLDSKNPIDVLFNFFYSYIWWIIAVCLLVAGIAYKSSMIGFISAITCLIGMVKGISDKSFIVFMLYVVTFICAYVITEDLRR